MSDRPGLRTRKGSGVYQAGRDRVGQILDASLDILIESGYQALTLREVARRCGVQLGAVTYYYKGRNDLLQDVLNMVLAPYGENFRVIREAPDLSAEQKLERLIRLLLEDIQTKKTTRLFPHLWVLANHDPFAARAVDRIYILERLTLNSLIAEINPTLTQQERETLSVYISASIAGSTMFVGFEKPWSSELPLYSAIASRALVDLVKTLKPEQLEAFGWRRQNDAKVGWRTPTLLPAEDFQAVVDEWEASPTGAFGKADP
ncbi:MAG TPA: TetR/AcrR family transcriptional regulator [Caulobacteraceae bacterium]|nr:TetR/AcrR family transcriptional regulator [Caulobacteraceae bacterium]